MSTRKGFVLSMWTGLLLNPHTERPILFATESRARRYLNRLPSWGHAAVSILPCTVRPNGQKGRPDYIVG